MHSALSSALLLAAIFPLVANSQWEESEVRDILFPTDYPETQDPWECALMEFTSYFSPPKPTGALLSAFRSYGSEVRRTCTSAEGCDLDDETWCDFTTAAPDMLGAYSSHASGAAAWWRSISGAAMDDAMHCPWSWYQRLWEHRGGVLELDATISHARCWEKMAAAGEAHTTGDASGSASSTSTGTATPGGSQEGNQAPSASSTTTPSTSTAPGLQEEEQEASATPEPENAGTVLDRDHGRWVAIAGVAAAIANVF